MVDALGKRDPFFFRAVKITVGSIHKREHSLEINNFAHGSVATDVSTARQVRIWSEQIKSRISLDETHLIEPPEVADHLRGGANDEAPISDQFSLTCRIHAFYERAVAALGHVSTHYIN